MKLTLSFAAMLVALLPAVAQAHCDTLDGPVVQAARQALASGDVSPVLGWVREKDEAQVREAFHKAVAVRKTGAAAQELADLYFFETLVRVHRAGEGEPYTGLKPAGTTEPGVALADASLEAGQLAPLARELTARLHEGLHRRFDAVMARQDHRSGDVAATRAYVEAYVPYVHFVERIHQLAGADPSHAHDASANRAPGHAH